MPQSHHTFSIAQISWHNPTIHTCLMPQSQVILNGILPPFLFYWSNLIFYSNPTLFGDELYKTQIYNFVENTSSNKKFNCISNLRVSQKELESTWQNDECLGAKFVAICLIQWSPSSVSVLNIYWPPIIITTKSPPFIRVLLVTMTSPICPNPDNW